MDSLRENIAEALLSIFHFSIDIRIGRVSGERHFGIYIFRVDASFHLRHAVMAVSDVELKKHIRVVPQKKPVSGSSRNAVLLVRFDFFAIHSFQKQLLVFTS